ncbi:MAG: response regulator [Desulfobacteraceae bacterium]|nr:response regulator [Desulfobacteraceae bacterium]
MAHILVLDDVPEAAVMIGKILIRKGHEVATFTEEEEALQYARSNQVDLAILDLKLRTMSGIAVLAALKKTNPATRAIVLTGYPGAETARQALSLGASHYCVKPVDKRELEEKVSQALG